MAARGYAVLLPDPALSTGYGRAFIARGHRDWGARPCADILAVTDAALARPDIDADPLERPDEAAGEEHDVDRADDH